MNTSHSRLQLSLVTLTWPILVENLLRTSFLSLDTLMLSNYSEHAVAAMSVVHSFGFFVQLLYLMVGVGANILISQHLGAKNEAKAGIVGIGSLVLIIAFSVVVSLMVAMAAEPLVGLFDLEPIVHRSAVQFLRIFGGGSLFLSLNIVQSNILRSWGHSRDPMVVNIVTLGLTMALNFVGLFGPFRFSVPGLFYETGIETSSLIAKPDLVVEGVMWVAFSTVVGHLVSSLILFILLIKRDDVVLPLRSVHKVPRYIYRMVLRVGVPSAGETLSYNLAHIVILSMIAPMGTKTLAAYGILLAVLRYVFITGVSIGLGTQIKVGYFVGAKQYEAAYRRVLLYFFGGFLFTVLIALMVYLYSRPLVTLFTEDEAILRLTGAIFFVALFHEPGRTFNTIIIPALKGAGDIIFPVVMALIMMWGIGVLGAWILGVHWGFGLVGIWIGLALDEWIRGIVMLFRWRSRIWTEKRLV